MCTEKIRPLSVKGAEKIAFTPKISEGRTEIYNYRVASLLNIIIHMAID